MSEQWEYRVVVVVPTPGPGEQHWLNKQGADGWELVAWVKSDLSGYAIFKRPRRMRRSDGREGER